MIQWFYPGAVLTRIVTLTGHIWTQLDRAGQRPLELEDRSESSVDRSARKNYMGLYKKQQKVLLKTKQVGAT